MNRAGKNGKTEGGTQSFVPVMDGPIPEYSQPGNTTYTPGVEGGDIGNVGNSGGFVWKYVSEDEYINQEDYEQQVVDLGADRDILDKEAYDFYKYLGDTLYSDKHSEYTEEYYKRIEEIESINTELRDLKQRREKSMEEEVYSASKITLSGDVVIEDSSLLGEPSTMHTVYISQDTAKLILDPEPIIKLSENTGLTIDQIISISQGVMDVSAGVLSQIAEIPGLGGFSILAGVYGVERVIGNETFIRPGIDKQLAVSEEGDYIYVRTSSPMGTAQMTTFGHTNGNTVFSMNYKAYEVKYDVEDINVWTIW